MQIDTVDNLGIIKEEVENYEELGCFWTVPHILKNILVIKISLCFVYSNCKAFQCDLFCDLFSLACNFSRHMTPSGKNMDFR